ncbi:TetR/AcrR family transcriptional regulator [Agromyces protaetiae]|uniref:TetR/AcrR family transcriptional regulator n=1 Tax=Agromyces protaetiae TaxID=2509455 RepID=A0A4P6F915_9MICO|nr:TetR/AcrR family transcriptional regulator [Agromyces protaetiae]QAY72065.1 TetR/AcrR family transcriptional regulator [Agromyces protaetiae]
MTSVEPVAAASAPATLRERKKAATRLALHEAAFALVEAHGLEATTVDQICEAADVSQRTFFNYFPSKSAAVLGLPQVVLTDDALARFRAARGELVPALCELVGHLADESRNTRRIKQLVAERPELGPAFTQWTSSLRETFFELARERAVSDESARTAVALVVSAFALTVHTPVEDDVDASEPAAVRLLRSVDRIVGARTAPMAEPRGER